MPLSALTPAPSLTSSKTLKWFTCVKPLENSARLVCAVRAATAELERGIAPAVLNSAGYRNFSSLPLKLQQRDFRFSYLEHLSHALRCLQARKLFDFLHLSRRPFRRIPPPLAQLRPLRLIHLSRRLRNQRLAEG
jgi:hypothetical protein